MTRAPLHIATAGWSIPARYRDLFPGDASHLARYARHLDAVEINSSFYRPHRRATYARWAASTPDRFRFAVKLPKSISHERRLRDCAAELDLFLAQATGLGDKLGILLLQLPPSFAFDRDLAASFFADLRRRTDIATVCEPRHASWFTDDADRLLANSHIARVAADPACVPQAALPGGWDGLAYYRLHGAPRIYYSDYDGAALAAIADRLASHQARGIPAWCVFDNTASGAALGNALAAKHSFAAAGKGETALRFPRPAR